MENSELLDVALLFSGADFLFLLENERDGGVGMFSVDCDLLLGGGTLFKRFEKSPFA